MLALKHADPISGFQVTFSQPATRAQSSGSESRAGKTMANARWSKDELKLAFHLYCQLPFGKLHQRNPEIVELARLLGRTPGSVAMKLVNFASLDPTITRSGRSGLNNASKLDREVCRRGSGGLHGRDANHSGSAASQAGLLPSGDSEQLSGPMLHEWRRRAVAADGEPHRAVEQRHRQPVEPRRSYEKFCCRWRAGK